MELQIGMFKHVREFCKTGISIESIGEKLYGSKTASLQGKIKLSVFQTPPLWPTVTEPLQELKLPSRQR